MIIKIIIINLLKFLLKKKENSFNKIKIKKYNETFYFIYLMIIKMKFLRQVIIIIIIH